MSTYPACRRFIVSAVLMAWVFFLFSAAGCNSDFRARLSLRRLVHREIKQFNKYHLRTEKPKVFIHGRRFYRAYKERIDHSVKMRSTRSEKAPYVAIISFTENAYLTKLREDRKDSRADSHFVLSDSRRREVIYTFVGGAWRRKNVY